MQVFMKSLQIETLRIPRDDRDGDGGRTKGFGYVEFSERSGLVGAISIVDPVIIILYL